MGLPVWVTEVGEMMGNLVEWSWGKGRGGFSGSEVQMWEVNENHKVLQLDATKTLQTSALGSKVAQEDRG